MTYKESFIKFMVDCGVLTFGEFTLKSGRKAPYFINCGNYKTGAQLAKLGEYYAECINANQIPVDTLFGPAYKGIPLAVATAIAIDELYGKEVRYCANRKEIKDHGDTGILLGSGLKDGDRVVMIEDVTTSGKSIDETYPILSAQADLDIKGLVVSLDRMEKGKGDGSALAEVGEKYSLQTTAIVTMADVTEYLYNKETANGVIIDDDIKKRIDEYYAQYGAVK